MRSHMRQKVQPSRGEAQPGETPVMGEFPDSARNTPPRMDDSDSPQPDEISEAAGGDRRNGGTADQSEADSVRGGLAARMLIAIIRVYQWTIAPLLPNCCRFEPTCSHYAVEALRLHGFWRGTGLTIWRLMRCQPFCRGGVDPVPPRRCDCPGARRGKR